jgi:O-antigen ligase
MKLQVGHSYDTLSLLEPVWVLMALLTFAAATGTGAAIMGLGLLALSFLQRWAFAGRFSRPTPFDLPWALLLAGGLVGLGVAYDPGLGWPVLLTLAGCIALYYVAANARKPEVLAQMAVLAGMAVALYFLAQYRYIPHTGKNGLLARLGGVISGPFPRLGSWEPFSNGVATLLEGLIPLGVALVAARRAGVWRALSAVAVALMALAVVVAASRGAWVALTVAGVVWAASRRRVTFIALLGIAILAAAGLGGYLLLAENAALEGVPVVGPVLYGLFARPDRLAVYRGSLRLIQDFPFTGIGPGTVFGPIYSRYVLLIPHVFLTYSHNLYLTVWLGHGLLGILGLVGIAAALIYSVAREHRIGKPSPLFQAAWVGALAVFVHGLFDARQYVDGWSAWPLFFLPGLVVATGAAGKERVTRSAPSRRWAWVALGVLAVVGLFFWRPLGGMAFANAGALRQAGAELVSDLSEQERTIRLRAAVSSYERALKLDADNRTAHLRLGNLAVAAGRYEEGVAHLEVAWRAAPEDPTACKALGLAYAWLGRIDEAAELLRDAKDIVAELNTWGYWHGSEGRGQVAMNAYRTSLALRADQPKVRELLDALEAKQEQ